jgi:beta-phosphoglucomutase-like phosphatase (HAD superfamily)
MTKKQATKPVEVKTDVTLADYSMFFELEYMLLNVREVAFQAVNEYLTAAGHSFSVPEFSRYCLYPSPQFYAAKLGAVHGLTQDKTNKLQSAVAGAVSTYLEGKNLQVNAVLKALAEAACARGVQVFALSAMPETKARKLLEAAQLSSAGASLFCCDEVDEHFPRADTWMRMARELGRSARRTVVCASSARSCKATLSAGMRAVAIPDAYTGFQDFGGAELVIEQQAEYDADAIVASLYPVLR